MREIIPPPPMLSADDLASLGAARQLLENPGVAARVANVLGAPIERGMRALPTSVRDGVELATHKALMQALRVAFSTLGRPGVRPSSDTGHKLAAIASGALGGVGGLATLAIELPISTTLMLRSIADIAASEGEPLDHIGTRLACLEVFALGGRGGGDDASESGYFASRVALAQAVGAAARHIAEKGLVEEGAPVIARLIATLASRFGVAVSEKAAAMAVPIVGAAGGALINALFMDHFQDMAHGHFTVRRLERAYGEEAVRLAYEAMA